MKLLAKILTKNYDNPVDEQLSVSGLLFSGIMFIGSTIRFSEAQEQRWVYFAIAGIIGAFIFILRLTSGNLKPCKQCGFHVPYVKEIHKTSYLFPKGRSKYCIKLDQFVNEDDRHTHCWAPKELAERDEQYITFQSKVEEIYIEMYILNKSW